MSTAGDVFPTQAMASPLPEPTCSLVASSSMAPVPDVESMAMPMADKGKAGKKEEEEEKVEVGGHDQAEEPMTPTSKGSRLHTPVECPPAPRKPVWAPSTMPPAVKRKFLSSAASLAQRAFFPVTRDLTTVFRALPPKKRIRVG